MAENSKNNWQEYAKDAQQTATNAYNKTFEVANEVQRRENDPNGYFRSCFKYGAMGGGGGAVAGTVLPGAGTVSGGAVGAACGCVYGVFQRYNELHDQNNQN